MVSAQDLAIKAKSPFSALNKTGRVLWGIVWFCLFRPSPRFLRGWRRFLLRSFGAKIASTANIYPGARVWAPWLVEIGAHAGIADGVVLYSQDWIRIGARVVISQEAYICTGTHDYTQPAFLLFTRPVIIADDVWIAARAFIHPGVAIGAGAVIGACAVITRDVAPRVVMAGNPARVVKTL